MSQLNIAIILGSTRPGRNGEAVAKWVHGLANKRTDARFELVDLLDFDLPPLDEPGSPAQAKYTKGHTKKWSAKVAEFDAYVFVTPEYNHSTSGALKNAIDFLNKEWTNKAAGFVGYGSVRGVRAVEHLRLIMAELQVATVRAQVGLSLFTDFRTPHVRTSRHAREGSEHPAGSGIAGAALKPLRTEKIPDDHNVLLAEGIE
ncbi:MAG: NAD(P)H-dependent oxidoreductase [Flavobacteriales bacterium]|nr:NAD(P)H-dependent oxidoreductase [Flavobacteriales bacterium]